MFEEERGKTWETNQRRIQTRSSPLTTDNVAFFSYGYFPTKYSSWKSSNLEFGFDMKIKKSMSNVVYIKNYCARRIINRALTLLSVSTWVNTTPNSFTAPWNDRDNLNALVFIYFSLVLVRWAHFPLYCKVYKSISIV